MKNLVLEYSTRPGWIARRRVRHWGISIALLLSVTIACLIGPAQWKRYQAWKTERIRLAGCDLILASQNGDLTAL